MGEGRGKWSGGTSAYDRTKALKLLGFEANTHRLRKRKQVRTIVRDLPHNTVHMLRISGHAFIMYQGKIWDQNQNGTPAETVWFNKCLVTHITTVEEIKQ